MNQKKQVWTNKQNKQRFFTWFQSFRFKYGRLCFLDCCRCWIKSCVVHKTFWWYYSHFIINDFSFSPLGKCGGKLWKYATNSNLRASSMPFSFAQEELYEDYFEHQASTLQNYMANEPIISCVKQINNLQVDLQVFVHLWQCNGGSGGIFQNVTCCT